MINSASLTSTTGYGAMPSISSITLGGGGGAIGSGYSAQAINLGSLEFDFNDNVKKYEVYEISQDLLALSVCWARYRKARNELGTYPTIDRKSTRLNSSHRCSSYAVFCLKKKNINTKITI